MKLIPPVINLDEETHRSEKKFFDLIKNINDPENRWTIFHSYELPRQDKTVLTHGYTAGEIDFLALDKETGLFVLIEVKGGNVYYKPYGKEWVFNGSANTRKHTPDEQLAGNLRNLQTALHKAFPTLFNDLSFETCLAFPETKSFNKSSLNMPVWIENDCLRLQDHFHTLSKSLECKNSKQDLRNIECYLGRQFRSVMVDYYCEERQESLQKLSALTEEQFKFLEKSEDCKRAFVLGCAGSGKTLMAIKKAQDLAAEGKKVLVLCYNLMLCNDVIRPKVAGNDNIDAFPFQECCEFILTERNAYPALPSDPKLQGQFYEETIPLAMLDYIEEFKGMYDTIIIDEAQDFHESYWELVEELEPSLSHLYVFYDREQRLNRYNREKFQTLIDKSESFQLFKNCRNTQAITDELKKHSEQPIQGFEDSPLGEAIIHKSYSSKKEKLELLRKTLHEMIYERGIPNTSIAIIGANRWDRVFDEENLKLGNYTVENAQASSKNSVPYYTYHKVKGCEFDYVIAFSVDEKWRETSYYSAYSRARLGLTIIEEKL